MKNRCRLFALYTLGATALFALTSCYTTSISDVGDNRLYGGELSELDVLGVSLDGAPEKAWRSGGATRPARGGRILLVQSGALVPDAELTDAFSNYFHIIPFSGRVDKSQRGNDTGSTTIYGVGKIENVGRGSARANRTTLSQRLRVAAASAGASHIVCVWGAVEREQVRHATKTVSWVPIVGQVVPDESTHTRIALRAAVVDTRGGAWDAVAAHTPISHTVSSSLNRSGAMTRLIRAAKESGYAELAGKVAGE